MLKMRLRQDLRCVAIAIVVAIAQIEKAVKGGSVSTRKTRMQVSKPSSMSPDLCVSMSGKRDITTTSAIHTRASASS